MPVQAVLDPGKQQMVVTFDRLLQAGSLEATNWTWLFGGKQYTAVDAAAAGDDVVLNGAPSGVEIGPDVVNYAPPPFDVVAQDPPGLSAKAFSDFPVV